jgi:hypothetical protein
MRGHDFGWKAVWDSNPDWSCIMVRLCENLFGLYAEVGEIASLSVETLLSDRM